MRHIRGYPLKWTIPNQEIRNLYCQIIEEWLSDNYGVEWYNQFIISLLSGKITEFKACLDKVFLKISGYYDLASVPEAFFYTLLLGFIASLQRDYEITTNQDIKLYRFDISLTPRDKIKNEFGIVIGLKFNHMSELLAETAQKAIFQVEEKKYINAFKQRDIKKVIQIGVGFKEKECVIEEILIGYDEISRHSLS